MRTLEEAIEYAEEVARANESLVSNYESDKIRAKIHRQLSAYLRELQERRKAPEIITCGECIHRFVEDENEPFNCCTLDHNDLQSDDWFCADAERKTE